MARLTIAVQHEGGHRTSLLDGRPAAGTLPRAPGRRPVSSNALLAGARPDGGRDANCRGASESLGDDAKHTRGEEKPHVTHLGNAHDVLVRSEDTRHDEIVGARNDR